MVKISENTLPILFILLSMTDLAVYKLKLFREFLQNVLQKQPINQLQKYET